MSCAVPQEATEPCSVTVSMWAIAAGDVRSASSSREPCSHCLCGMPSAAVCIPHTATSGGGRQRVAGGCSRLPAARPAPTVPRAGPCAPWASTPACQTSRCSPLCIHTCACVIYYRPLPRPARVLHVLVLATVGVPAHRICQEDQVSCGGGHGRPGAAHWGRAERAPFVV